MSFTFKHKMGVAGHRGDSYNFYENTITAFKEAIKAGVDMIETDVQLTLDNHLVLIHDDTVNRTTNSEGRVQNMTLNELRALNAGDSASYEKIPTLRELFELIKDTDITVNIEIKEYYSKENKQRAIECIEKTIELMEEYKLGPRCLINSFDAWVLEYVYKKYGNKYALHGFYPYSIMSNVSIDPTKYLYCACIFDSENKSLYDFLLSYGIEPWIGASITQKSKLKTCLSYGAKLITTNNPADVIKKLKEIENEQN